jgi:outer membrane receptor protein involved in Fe transport
MQFYTLKKHFQFLKTLSVFAFIFFLQKAQGQISGVVRAADSGEDLVGCLVEIKGEKKVTDLDGSFSFPMLTSGTYEVSLSMVGFDKFNKSVNFLTQTPIELRLTPSNTLLMGATVTTSKFERPLGEATVSLEVLKPKLIESVGTRKLDDVLQKIPGVNIIDGQANIRGGSGWSYGAGSRVLLLVDDIPALQADAGFPNWKDLPIENIEQVEVVKGAASALYGSAAMNGIINVRTGFAKSKPETKISTFGVVYLAPSDDKKYWWKGQKTPYEAGGSILHKQRFGKLDVAGSVFYSNFESYNKNWFDRYGRVSLSTRYRITDRLSVGLNTNINTGSNRNFFYWNNHTDSAYVGNASAYSASSRVRYFLDPYVTYFDGAGNRHKLLGRLYSVQNNANNNQANSSRLYYGEYQFLRNFEKLGLVVTAGTVLTASGISAKLYGDTSFSSTNTAIYTQIDKKWGKLNFSAGARWERNSLNAPKLTIFRKPRLGTFSFPNDTVLTPNGGRLVESKPVFRVGLNYQVAKATFVRVSWGQGYRFPTVAESFISTSAGALNIVPNPNLTSETGQTAEIGVKQGFNIGGFYGFLDAAYFWSQYRNMMEFLASPTVFFSFQSQNVGNTRISGVDFSLAGQGKMGEVTTSTLIGYTYIVPRYELFRDTVEKRNSTADYNVLKYRFKHSFKADLEVSYEKLTLGGAFLYNSRTEAIDAVLDLLKGVKAYRLENATGFRTLDLRVAYQFTKKIKLNLIGSNVLNEEYSYRPGLLEAPRNVQLRLDLAF